MGNSQREQALKKAEEQAVAAKTAAIKEAAQFRLLKNKLLEIEKAKLLEVKKSITLYKQSREVDGLLKQARNINKGNFQQLLTKRTQIFEQYLQTLKPSDFHISLPKDKNARYYVIVGNISSGKSSFINYFYEKNLQVGVGETTTVINKIEGFKIPGTSKTIYIWDTPGTNEKYNVSNPQCLNIFSTADKIFVLHKADGRDIEELLRVIYVFKQKNVFLVRTQCDSGIQDEKAKRQRLVKLREQDEKFILNLKMKEIPVFQVAVNNQNENGEIKIGLDQFDNAAVKRELTSWLEK